MKFDVWDQNKDARTIPTFTHNMCVCVCGQVRFSSSLLIDVLIDFFYYEWNDSLILCFYLSIFHLYFIYIGLCSCMFLTNRFGAPNFLVLIYFSGGKMYFLVDEKRKKSQKNNTHRLKMTLNWKLKRNKFFFFLNC